MKVLGAVVVTGALWAATTSCTDGAGSTILSGADAEATLAVLEVDTKRARCVLDVVEVRWPEWREQVLTGSWPDDESAGQIAELVESCRRRWVDLVVSSNAPALAVEDPPDGVVSEADVRGVLRGVIEAAGGVASDEVLACSAAGLRHNAPGMFDRSLPPPSEGQQVLAGSILEWCYEAMSR